MAKSKGGSNLLDLEIREFVDPVGQRRAGDICVDTGCDCKIDLALLCQIQQ